MLKIDDYVIWKNKYTIIIGKIVNLHVEHSVLQVLRLNDEYSSLNNPSLDNQVILPTNELKILSKEEYETRCVLEDFS
jgi:hypothetical protein